MMHAMRAQRDGAKPYFNNRHRQLREGHARVHAHTAQLLELFDLARCIIDVSPLSTATRVASVITLAPSDSNVDGRGKAHPWQRTSKLSRCNAQRRRLAGGGQRGSPRHHHAPVTEQRTLAPDMLRIPFSSITRRPRAPTATRARNSTDGCGCRPGRPHRATRPWLRRLSGARATCDCTTH